MRPNTLSTRSSAPVGTSPGKDVTQAPKTALTVRFTWTRSHTCPPPAPKHVVISSDAAFIYALRAAQLTRMVRDGGYRPPVVRMRLPATQRTFTINARTAPQQPLSDDARAIHAIRASNYLFAALAALGSPRPRFEQSAQNMPRRMSQPPQRDTIATERKSNARKPIVIYQHPATRDDITAVGRRDARNDSIVTNTPKREQPAAEAVPSYVVPLNADGTLPEHVRKYVAPPLEQAVPQRTVADADREMEELQNRQREAQERAAMDLQAYAQAMQAQDNPTPATPQQPAVDLQAYAQALQAQGHEKAGG